MLTFYKEWLPLKKSEFRLLAMLADLGSFKGSLSTICRYLGVSEQTKNREKIRSALQQLKSDGFIEYEMSGRLHKISLLPKETEILLPRKYFDALMQTDYEKEEVSREAVIKVFLWICNNRDEVITNNDISTDLQISASTIGSAKNVLERQFGAIFRHTIKVKTLSDHGEEHFTTIGQELKGSAWWANEP